MDNQKNPVAAQQYRMKSSIEEYEANGLNSLLMQMHHWALDKRIVSRRDSLIYFNVAYAVAAPLEAISAFSVKLVRRKIEDLFEESILKRKIRKFSQNDTLLSLWMVYGILHLQCHRSYKLNCRLEKIRSEITEDFILWEVPHMKFGSVATQFSAMIDAVEDRFYSPELHEVKPDHRDSGEQPMNLNEMKIQALEAQLEEEKEKNEHCKAIEKSNYLTASFNLQLEKRFKLLESQLEDVNARHNREMRNMQLIIEQKDEEIRQLKELLKSRVSQKGEWCEHRE